MCDLFTTLDKLAETSLADPQSIDKEREFNMWSGAV
jgi:hypothetical protein